MFTTNKRKVRLYNNDESFIKVGMTTKSLEERLKYIPYKFEVIKLIEGSSEHVYDLENRFKKIFKKYSYKPLINFKGETECFIL